MVYHIQSMVCLLEMMKNGVQTTRWQCCSIRMLNCISRKYYLMFMLRYVFMRSNLIDACVYTQTDPNTNRYTLLYAQIVVSIDSEQNKAYQLQKMFLFFFKWIFPSLQWLQANRMHSNCGHYIESKQFMHTVKY